MASAVSVGILTVLATLIGGSNGLTFAVAGAIVSIYFSFRYWSVDFPLQLLLEWGDEVPPREAVESRDVMYQIGRSNPKTIIDTLRVTFDDGVNAFAETFVADRSFVEFQMARGLADITYAAARTLYGLDRYSNVACRERSKVMDGTARALCFFQLLRRIEIARSQRLLYLTQESNDVTCKLESRRLYKSMQVVAKHHWWMNIIVFVCGAFLLYLSYRGLRVAADLVSVPTYLRAKHLPFTGEGLAAKPASRPGFSIQGGSRKKESVTYSESLVTAEMLPKLRNQQFDRNDPSVANGAAEYRLGVSNGVSEFTGAQQLKIDNVINELVTDFSRYIAGKPVYDIMNPDDCHRWIESRPYTQLRKGQMHDKVHELLNGVDFGVDPHIKNESYAKTTRPRFICARRDDAKVLFGPIFDALNDWFFHLPFTTKHVPVVDRPTYIENRLNRGPATYFVTDHSAFECAATEEVQRMIEMKLYKACTPAYVHPILEELLKNQTMIFRGTGMTMKVPCMRFSGEMNTSLGNSILNYVSIMVAADTMNVKVDCVVEGDDALIVGPSGMDLEEYQMVMRRMGFNVKLDQVESLGSAGYCSSRWTSDLLPMPDARSFLPDLFWTDPTSLKTMSREELLSAKVMSYAYECPYMPVMYKVYQKYLMSYGKSRLNQYEVSEMSRMFAVKSEKDYYVISGKIIVREPTIEERDRFNELYHLDVPTQLALESCIDTDQASCLEEFFALLGGNVDFARDQYVRQVVSC
jgi:hypothetical protein